MGGSLPHGLAGDSAEGGVEAFLDLDVLGGRVEEGGLDLEALGLVLVERLEGELALVVAEQRPQLEVVLRVQVRLHGYIILNQLQELLLQLVQVFRREEGVDESEVGVREVKVVPDFLGYEDGDHDDGAPVGGLQGDVCEGDQAVDVDEADDAAFGRELGAVVEGADEVQNLLDRRHLPQQGDPLLVKGLGSLLDVLLLAKVEQIRRVGNVSALAQVLVNRQTATG